MRLRRPDVGGRLRGWRHLTLPPQGIFLVLGARSPTMPSARAARQARTTVQIEDHQRRLRHGPADLAAVAVLGTVIEGGDVA